MISKGLKVGDIFVDEDTPYVVLKVCEDGNYISRRLTAEEAKKAAENAQKKSSEKSEAQPKTPRGRRNR